MTILAMRNFEGYGKDHIEHFNMIWDGKIDRKTRPLSEMKKQSWIFVLKVIFATINVVSYLIIYYVYLNNSITILLGLYYPIVLFFVMYASTDFFGVISALLPDEDYRELPDDIYQEMIGRYFDYNLKDPSIQENQKDFLKILQSQERKLRVWQISCPICKTDIREGDDLLIQCQVCQRVYHETHLQSYFDNQSSSDKNCVVCQTKIMDAFQEFVILKG